MRWTYPQAHQKHARIPNQRWSLPENNEIHLQFHEQISPQQKRWRESARCWLHCSGQNQSYSRSTAIVWAVSWWHLRFNWRWNQEAGGKGCQRSLCQTDSEYGRSLLHKGPGEALWRRLRATILTGSARARSWRIQQRPVGEGPEGGWRRQQG